MNISTINTITLTGLITMQAILGYYTVQVLKEDLKQYREDMKCVNVLTSQGVERKDIDVKDGVCFIEEDIYYTSLSR